MSIQFQKTNLRELNAVVSSCLYAGYSSKTFGNVGRDSTVGLATGYGLDDRKVWVRVPVGPRILSSPQLPDRIWVPLSRSSGYREEGSFLKGKGAEA
jgi:hypothetical protein